MYKLPVLTTRTLVCRRNSSAPDLVLCYLEAVRSPGDASVPGDAPVRGRRGSRSRPALLAACSAPPRVARAVSSGDLLAHRAGFKATDGSEELLDQEISTARAPAAARATLESLVSSGL